MVPQKWTEKNIDVDRSALPSFFHLRLTDHKLRTDRRLPIPRRTELYLACLIIGQRLQATPSLWIVIKSLSMKLNREVAMGSRVPFTVLLHLQHMANTMSGKHV